MPDFANRLVVITGVGRQGQVGEALALGFAQRGASLALLDRDQAQVEARAAELTQQGFTATAHVANLADAADAERAAREVLAAHGTTAVHAVVCTAGGFGMTGPVSDANQADWARQFMINLDTAFATTRAFLPALREGQGALVYFGSVAALPQGNPKGMAAYAAAKSGVLSLMRTVAVDEKSNGVRANAVAPTAIRTATNIADMGDKTEYVERESVADVVAFLASPEARNVSGQVITLA
ncbi:MAG: SDR family oxidoreductase [Gemmatimonadaceae bacterium]|nr:SDR family oxidoreductase [Gemmatimonadaceae bacterium]